MKRFPYIRFASNLSFLTNNFKAEHIFLLLQCVVSAVKCWCLMLKNSQLTKNVTFLGGKPFRINFTNEVSFENVVDDDDDDDDDDDYDDDDEDEVILLMMNVDKRNEKKKHW